MVRGKREGFGHQKFPNTFEIYKGEWLADKM